MHFFRSIWLLLILAAPISLLPTAVQAQETRPPNVLVITVDDLNTDLGTYGNTEVKTPNIDRLASRGVRFDRAYCQFPLCSPSRTSFWSGRRPEATGVLNNELHPRTFLGQSVPFLADYFRRGGYLTARAGKTLHGENFEPAQQWDISVPQVYDHGIARYDPPDALPGQLTWKATDRLDEEENDGKTARAVAQIIEQNKDRPFFIQTGFYKPHRPEVAPKKYFDLYNPEAISLRSGPANDWDDIPLIARRGHAYETDKWTAQRIRESIRAYYACVSFIDAQVGLIMDTLDRLNLTQNTIVVFTSDHGYLLGEHRFWHKPWLFERCVRVPLIITAPGVPGAVASPRIVELVDVYPTLTEMAGLPAPEGIDGTSLSPLLRDPTRKWKNAAYTVRLNNLQGVWPHVGYSVRTERYRYTEWPDGTRELYDYDTDPSEWTNVVNESRYDNIVREHRTLIQNRLAPHQPTDITLTGHRVEAGSRGGTAIGVLSATDPDDAVGSHRFVLTNDAGGRFRLRNNELQVASGASLVGDTTHTIVVRAIDPAYNMVDRAFTIVVTLAGLDISPRARSLAVELLEDTPTGITLSGTGVDGTTDGLTYAIVSAPARGRLSGTLPNLVYTPDRDFPFSTSSGTDRFTYRVNDGVRDSNIATVSLTVTPRPDRPIARGEVFSIVEGSVLRLASTLTSVLDNDNDPDRGAPITVAQVVVSPSYGTLQMPTNGAFTYTPNVFFRGTDTFTYNTQDPDGIGNTTRVTIRVLAAPLTVSAISPSTARAGTSIYVYGTGFTQSAVVTFTGTTTPGTVTPISSKQLQVTIPGGTTTGPVTVTDGGKSVTSSAMLTIDDSVLAPSSAGGWMQDVLQARAVWKDNSTNETAFDIERADSGALIFSGLSQAPANATFFVDRSVQSGKTYQYRVRARNGTVVSAYSNTVTIAVPPVPAAPSLLSASAASSTSVNLRWLDNSGNERGFLIERAGVDGVFTQIASVAPNTALYTDTTATPGTTYSYRVRAWNYGGYSAWSGVARTITPNQ